MEQLPQHYDALSEHDKLLVKSFIYLRASKLCLHCHKPADEVDVIGGNEDLSKSDGFCYLCHEVFVCDLVPVNVRL